MSNSIEWDKHYKEYVTKETSDSNPECDNPNPYEPSKAIIPHIASPTNEDISWLKDALRDEKKKWFVAELANLSNEIAEAFFEPLLDAGIDELDPSFNRCFIEPCVKAFGHRRVNKYLLDVVEWGTNFRKAGAVNALYWAQVSLSFSDKPISYSIEHATPESRAAYEALADLRARRRILLLETFISNANVDIRRSIIPSLDLDPSGYSKDHRKLVEKAIKVARSSEDEYIRHRVEYQLGNINYSYPLPHRGEE